MDKGAKIKNAKDLWGKNIFDTTRILKKRVGGKYTSVACIGPAGRKPGLHGVHN